MSQPISTTGSGLPMIPLNRLWVDPPAHASTKKVRKPSAAKISENRTQGQIRKALRQLGYFVTSFSQAQRAQMTAGIPDLFACHPRFPALWVEVKAPHRRNHRNGGCSTDQLQWISNARECGQVVVVAYGLEDVLVHLRNLKALS